MNIAQLKKLLAELYTPSGPERVGFVKGKQIIEVKNTSPNPIEGFMVSCEDIEKYTEKDKCEATWHTHPEKDSNLSGEDYKMMTSWPDLTHFIIGKDGVRAYKYDEKKKAVLEVQ